MANSNNTIANLTVKDTDMEITYTDNKKTIKLAEKIHYIIYHDSADLEYYATSGRYGRSNPSSREYIYNGTTYGNDKTKWMEAMEKDGYDPKKMVNTDDMEYVSDMDAKWDLYCNHKMQKYDYSIFPQELKNQIAEWKKEGERLMNLKSERSHKKGRELLAKANDPQWKILEEKQKRAYISTAIVNSFAHDSYYAQRDMKTNFEQKGEHTYTRIWNSKIFD
jgi:hypothetical protein